MRGLLQVRLLEHGAVEGMARRSLVTEVVACAADIGLRPLDQRGEALDCLVNPSDRVCQWLVRALDGQRSPTHRLHEHAPEACTVLHPVLDGFRLFMLLEVVAQELRHPEVEVLMEVVMRARVACRTTPDGDLQVLVALHRTTSRWPDSARLRFCLRAFSHRSVCFASSISAYWSSSSALQRTMSSSCGI